MEYTITPLTPHTGAEVGTGRHWDAAAGTLPSQECCD